MSYLGRKGAQAPLTTADIPDNSITGAKIVDGTVAIADIGADAVGTDELANDVVITTTGLITANGGLETDTNSKIKQKGAFMQSSTHQAMFLGG